IFYTDPSRSQIYSLSLHDALPIYKGYRFIKKSSNKIPYTHFDEVIAIYEFDMKLKSLFYPYIMQIETAFKNYTLNTIIDYGSADFDYIFSNLLNDYKKHSVGGKDYKKKMKSRLDLKSKVHNAISYNYNSNKPVIQHYFHNNNSVPLWARSEEHTSELQSRFDLVCSL